MIHGMTVGLFSGGIVLRILPIIAPLLGMRQGFFDEGEDEGVFLVEVIDEVGASMGGRSRPVSGTCRSLRRWCAGARGLYKTLRRSRDWPVRCRWQP